MFHLGCWYHFKYNEIFLGERNFKFIESERNTAIGLHMFTVHPLYPASLNAAKNGWICIFIYDTFVIMCNKCNKINRQTAIWGRFSLIYLSDIDLIKITCNNGHFPMDMLEQDEIIDNLRRVELYWILYNFNKIITPAWYLRETYSSFLRQLVTPGLSWVTLLGERALILYSSLIS